MYLRLGRITLRTIVRGFVEIPLKLEPPGGGDCGSRLSLLRAGALLVAGGRVARWGISYFYEGRATRRDSACP